MSRASALRSVLRSGRRLRTLGVDDGPFRRGSRRDVLVVGAVYSDHQFEGLLSCRVRQDGHDATARLTEMICGSKFAPQLHLVVLDGIALGGFNVVDLPALAQATALPCVAVMRRQPDLVAVERAIAQLPRARPRLARLAHAGPIRTAGAVRFQCAGVAPETAARAIARSVCAGHLPECVRAAHLIASGIVTGQSGRRA